MAGETRVIYDDFTGGEYGAPGGAKAPDNSFTGRNVLVYRSGLIGPRPGIKASTVESSIGTLANMWRGIRDGSSADADVWNVSTVGSVRFRKRTPGGYTFLAGVIGAIQPTKPPQAVHIGLGKYAMTNILDATWIVDLTQMGGEGSGGTPLVDSGGPGCSTIAYFSHRVFVANDGSTTGFRRVFYSEPGAPTTWPVENYFDVPSKSGVAALVTQRDHLAILMEDGSWWVFRGAGASASLRKVTSAEYPEWYMGHNSVAGLTDDEVLGLTVLGDWPVRFTGSELEHLYRHGPDGDGAPYDGMDDVKVMRLRRPGEAAIILVTKNRMYLCKDGVWTLHTIPAGMSAASSAEGSGLLLFADNLSPHNYFDFDINLTRPGFTSDTFARPGDLSDTPVDAYFTLPEWWSQPGTEVRVRQVIVDFIKYETGSPSTNNMDLELSVFGRYDQDDAASPSAQSWSEAGTSAEPEGVRDRVTFNVGEQGYGAGFQVGLSSIRGVAIKTITVVLDTQPSTPRW